MASSLLRSIGEEGRAGEAQVIAPLPRINRRADDSAIRVGLVVIAAVGCVLAGLAPTGGTVADVALVAVISSLVVWAAGDSPWWAGVVASAIAALIAFDSVGLTLGLVAGGVGLFAHQRGVDNVIVRTAVAGAAVNGLARSELDVVLGLTAVVGTFVCGGLLVLGHVGGSPRVRRWTWIIGSVVGVVIVAALIALTVSARTAREDLSVGAAHADNALALLRDGDYVAASTELEQSAASFRRVEHALSQPVALPARMIPGLAQNLRAGSVLSAAARDALDEAARALDQIDPAAMSLVDGRIDLESIADVADPLQRVSSSFDDLTAATRQVRSPWLLPPVTNHLDVLAGDLDEQAANLERALDAVEVAPALLGADGPRRYLVLFTSPAEARGLGGIIGNYADVSVDDGRISVSDFGRRSGLDDVVRTEGATCVTCPEDLLGRYGRFGLTTGIDGRAGGRVWSNLTMSSHFPDVAEAAAILYPQSGGASVDGVFVMDPYVVQALMHYTGPIEVPELDVVVEPHNAANFILREQYVLADDDQPDRVDALQSLGSEAIRRLLAGELPDPMQLSRDLAPLIEERRLLGWTDRIAERAVFESAGLLGALPELRNGRGFAVSVTNGSANKVDVFLEREVSAEVVDEADGSQTLAARVVLTNHSPESGLPNYVIGNEVGMPLGSSRLFVTFYGPPTLQSAHMDGTEFPLERRVEGGWSAYGQYIDLRAGERRTVDLRFELTSTGDAEIVTFEQPLSDRPG